jgi:hypothetical protein
MLHQFWLLRPTEWSYHHYDMALLRSHPTKITIHNDLIQYMYDSLEWVATTNPANNKEWKGRGLNMYGPTIITKTGAAHFAAILIAWAALFDNGPPIVQLTGLWTYEIDEEEEKTRGKYNTIRIARDDCTARIRSGGYGRGQ